MGCDISQYLEELGYTSKQIYSVLKTISSLKNIRVNSKSNKSTDFKRILENGSPLFVSYPDQLITSNESSIGALDHFLSKYFSNIPIYILPCWETTGDGGFSIKNFTHPRLRVGKIDDLRRFCHNQIVCIDMVLSNISAEHIFVKNHLKLPYQEENSIVAELVDKNPNDIPKSHRGHSNVRKFESIYGDRWLWTTFSPHQVNLNYSSPKTLKWLLRTIAFYLDIGALSIRLDAVPFLWTKESGPILHAPQCHSIVKIIRSFIDYYKPDTLLIAQTDYASKPLHDYIGTDDREAQLLYRHELAPILIHGIISKQKIYIEKWIQNLVCDPDHNWINFLSTCDGIFLRPWDYPLPTKAIQLLTDACLSGGGTVQYYHWENHPPATLCTTTWSILHYQVNDEITKKRVLLANAMLLALPGIPALFFNSFFGMENWKEWRTLEEEARSIVRERYSAKLINQLLQTSNSRQYQLYKNLKQLIDIRIQHPAICQNSQVDIISDVPENVVAWSLSFNGNIVSFYFNIGDQSQEINIQQNMRILAGEPIINRKIKLMPLSYSWMEYQNSKKYKI